jgi:hypothetical protein
LIFSAREIVAACEKAKAVGDPTYSSVFSIATSGRASSSGSAQYLDLTARAGGKEGKLVLRFKDEVAVGRIQPLTGGEYNRDPTRTPALGVQKYCGDEAAPSAYFAAVECLDVFFQAEAAKRLGDGRFFKKNRDATQDGTKVKSDHVVRLFQSTISMAAKENPGGLLTNPITRLGLKFDESGAPRKGSQYFLRYSVPDAPGRYHSEPMAFDGAPLSADNCHQIVPGSKLSGVVDLSAACASSMGISVPITLKCLFVELAPPKTFSEADVFGDED